MDPRTDEEIIRVILNGQVADYRHIVKRHQQMVYKTAFSVTRNHEAAQEVTQDVFMKTFSSLHSFQGKSRFTTWLFRIVYHKALNYLEAIASHKKHFVMDEAINTDEYIAADSIHSLTGKDQVKYIKQALGQLTADDRIALSLYYFDELSQPEISALTGWSLASTKQRIHRARAKLDEVLNKILSTEKSDLL